jgi:hypothetical protein
MPLAYEEVVDFIAAGPTSSSVADFRASEETREKVADLIHRQKTTGLSLEESAELNHFMQLEHVMRLAKARARVLLDRETT